MATRAMAGGVACLFCRLRPRRRWGKAARRLEEPCGPEARGGGTRACTGAVRGVRRRHSPATTAARRRSNAGGARNRGERGRGGRGAHHELILGVDLGGEGPEARIDVKGRSSMVLQWRPAAGQLISVDSTRKELW